MSIKIYVENKCYQCWLCKNRVGSDNHGHPECKVAQKYMYEVYEEPCHYFEPTERAKDLIIKSTDVQEVIHGEWIYDGVVTRCSNCGDIIEFDDCQRWDSNYCPNCGARMDGEK